MPEFREAPAFGQVMKWPAARCADAHAAGVGVNLLSNQKE
jgi:hypothetical protein